MSEESTNSSAPEPKKKAAPKKAAPKSAAKSTTAKKAAPKKAAAAKAPTKKAPTRKAPAKMSPTSKAAAPKAAAKKPAAKSAASKAAKPEPKVSSVADEQERISEAADQAESTDTAARAGASERSESGSTHGFDADQFKQAMKEKDWSTYLTRLLFVVMFSAIGFVAIQAIIVLAIVQLVLTLLNDSPNETVKSAMTILGRYISDIMDYLSFASDDRPFPLGKALPSDD